jgi:hypothetical protein
MAVDIRDPKQVEAFKSQLVSEGFDPLEIDTFLQNKVGEFNQRQPELTRQREQLQTTLRRIDQPVAENVRDVLGGGIAADIAADTTGKVERFLKDIAVGSGFTIGKKIKELSGAEASSIEENPFLTQEFKEAFGNIRRKPVGEAAADISKILAQRAAGVGTFFVPSGAGVLAAGGLGAAAGGLSAFAEDDATVNDVAVGSLIGAGAGVTGNLLSKALKGGAQKIFGTLGKERRRLIKELADDIGDEDIANFFRTGDPVDDRIIIETANYITENPTATFDDYVQHMDELGAKPGLIKKFGELLKKKGAQVNTSAAARRLGKPRLKEGGLNLFQQMQDEGIRTGSIDDVIDDAARILQENGGKVAQQADDLTNKGVTIDPKKIVDFLDDKIKAEPSAINRAPFEKVKKAFLEDIGESTAIDPRTFYGLKQAYGGAGSWNQFTPPTDKSTAKAFNQLYMRMNDVLDDTLKEAGIKTFRDTNRSLHIATKALHFANRNAAQRIQTSGRLGLPEIIAGAGGLIAAGGSPIGALSGVATSQFLRSNMFTRGVSGALTGLGGAMASAPVGGVSQAIGTGIEAAGPVIGQAIQRAGPIIAGQEAVRAGKQLDATQQMTPEQVGVGPATTPQVQQIPPTGLEFDQVQLPPTGLVPQSEVPVTQTPPMVAQPEGPTAQTPAMLEGALSEEALQPEVLGVQAPQLTDVTGMGEQTSIQAQPTKEAATAVERVEAAVPVLEETINIMGAELTEQQLLDLYGLVKPEDRSVVQFYLKELQRKKEVKTETSKKPSQVSQAEAGKAVINELEKLYTQVQDEGLTARGAGLVGEGRLMGLTGNIAAKLQTSTAAANYQRSVNSFLARLARAAGETGALTNTDLQRIEGAIPRFTDTPAVAEKQFELLDILLQSAIEAFQNTPNEEVPANQGVLNSGLQFSP